MRRIASVLIPLMFAVFGALPAAAQVNGFPFEVSGFEQRTAGFDRVVSVSVRNTAPATERVTGRLIVISVYDTRPPETLPITGMDVPPGEERTIEMRWSEAPLLGQARALLVLQDRRGRLAVEAFEFWIVPWQGLAVFGGAALVLIGLVMLTVRYLGASKEHSEPAEDEKKPKKKKRRKKKVPAGMALHIAEFDDTVVRVAERYGVTWEDVVRANKLKPPYTLQEGQELLIPEHDLHRPHDT